MTLTFCDVHGLTFEMHVNADGHTTEIKKKLKIKNQANTICWKIKKKVFDTKCHKIFRSTLLFKYGNVVFNVKVQKSHVQTFLTVKKLDTPLEIYVKWS